MSIRFACECGTQFIAGDEQAGSRGVCHVCKKQFIVPVQDDPQSGQPISQTAIPQYPLKKGESQPQTPVGTDRVRRSGRTRSSSSGRRFQP